MKQKLFAEFLGTSLLLATVVGSGIMAETLSDGNIAIALLGNTLATGAMLVVLISIFGPISGAHFNPVVTFIAALKGEIRVLEALWFVLTQGVAAILGVWLAHIMFALDVIQTSTKVRYGVDQWLSEGVATFGLLLTIILGSHHAKAWVPALVGLYISSAYWFTASTSFANPAVTIARALSDSFAGIRPLDVPAFIAAQIVGALGALLVSKILEPSSHDPNHLS
jgi:glycerol uptake facilitator-like aquaporin